MSDHDALRALLQRYARAVDSRDIDALAVLFAPDAVIVGARGTSTLPEWLETMRGPRAFPISQHLIGEPLVTVEGDRATLDTYAVVHQLQAAPSEGSDLTLGIRYLDDVIRTGDTWVFARRESTTLWMR